jgi:hypothetical protein
MGGGGTKTAALPIQGFFERDARFNDAQSVGPRYYVLESLCLRIIIFAIQLPRHATAVYQPQPELGELDSAFAAGRCSSFSAAEVNFLS